MHVCPRRGWDPEKGPAQNWVRCQVRFGSAPRCPGALQNSVLPLIPEWPLIDLPTTLHVNNSFQLPPKAFVTGGAGHTEDGNLDPHKTFEKAKVP